MKRTMYITEKNNTSRCDKVAKNGHKTLQLYISPSNATGAVLTVGLQSFVPSLLFSWKPELPNQSTSQVNCQQTTVSLLVFKR